jgi:hypothetical protein
MVRAKIGDNLVDLTTLALQKDSVEKVFDLELWQLQSAIEIGSFEIAETFDQLVTKKPSLVVKFSTVGLEVNIVALEQNVRQRATKVSD